MGCSHSKHTPIPTHIDVKRKIMTSDIQEKPVGALGIGKLELITDHQRGARESLPLVFKSVSPPKQKLSPLRTVIATEEVARPQSVENDEYIKQQTNLLVDVTSIQMASGGSGGALDVIVEEASTRAASVKDVALDAIKKDPCESGVVVQVSKKVPVLSESDMIDILNIEAATLESKIVLLEQLPLSTTAPSLSQLLSHTLIDANAADDSSVSTEFTFVEEDTVPCKKMTVAGLKDRALCVLVVLCTVTVYAVGAALFGWISYNVIQPTRESILLHLQADPFGASKLKASLMEVTKTESEFAKARASIKLVPIKLGNETKRADVSNVTRKHPILVPRNTKVMTDFTGAKVIRRDQLSASSAVSSSVFWLNLNGVKQELSSLVQDAYDFIDADNYFI